MWYKFVQSVRGFLSLVVDLRVRTAVSPEVIRGQGYTYSCDWWSLGVIMFECLYGYVIFFDYFLYIHLDIPLPTASPPSLATLYVPSPIATHVATTNYRRHDLAWCCPRASPACQQRHVTRQKILNWKQSLRFPSRPRVSHEGVDLMQQLLCEPEDRLGSQASASVTRPNSMIVQARRSGFVAPAAHGAGSVDGAELIKVRFPPMLLPSGEP